MQLKYKILQNVKTVFIYTLSENFDILYSL